MGFTMSPDRREELYGRPAPAPIALTLPEPPSANRYWRHNRGRTHLSSEAIAYRQAVANAALRARVGKPLDGPVVLTVRWFRARRSGDLDNRLKQLGDALQGVLLQSDAQIAELHAFRDDTDRRNPRVEITLTPVP